MVSRCPHSAWHTVSVLNGKEKMEKDAEVVLGGHGSRTQASVTGSEVGRLPKGLGSLVMGPVVPSFAARGTNLAQNPVT